MPHRELLRELAEEAALLVRQRARVLRVPRQVPAPLGHHLLEAVRVDVNDGPQPGADKGASTVTFQLESVFKSDHRAVKKKAFAVRDLEER